LRTRGEYAALDALMVLEGSFKTLKLTGTDDTQDDVALVAWNQRRCDVAINDDTSHKR